MCGNKKEWEKIATGLPSPTFAWSEVNPLIPYSFRIVGRNQFGVGVPSRTTHVDAQVGKFQTPKGFFRKHSIDWMINEFSLLFQ